VSPLRISRARRTSIDPPRVETGHLIAAAPVEITQGSRIAATPCYLQLIQKLSAVRAALSGAGVFAFTAANPCDGVSYVVRSLARELAAASGERVLHAPASILGEGPCTVALHGAESSAAQQPTVYAVKESSPARKDWEARLVVDNLNEIRSHFGWVLIDCPSLRQSDLALALTPHMDGVVLVVAADETKRADIARARKSFAIYAGALLGFVLNKRTYPVPDFLYQRL
jgi:hypothetical protein